MTSPSLKKPQTTPVSMLPLTGSKLRRRASGRLRLLGSACIASTLLGSSLLASEQVEDKTSVQAAEQAAAERWQDLRRQIWPEQSAARVFPSTASAGGTPVRTTPEEVSKESTLKASSTSYSRGGVTPVSGRDQQGQVVHSFVDSSEPLATPRSENAIQPVSLPDFLAMQTQALEGKTDMAPIPAAPGGLLNDSLQGGQFSSQTDTLFQPITRIQANMNYSPTSGPGKPPYEYICPQPSSIPDDQRARCPELQPLPQQGSTARHFDTTEYNWVAADLKHKPLYFEDVQLERYGQAAPYGVQPFVSLGKFTYDFFALPYNMALDPVHRDIYALGYYRPGDNAPILWHQIPLNAKAAASAAGVYTGFAFLIP